MVIVPLARLGMGVWQDRMVLPRHFINSDIVLSDTSVVARTDKIEFEPSVSPDGSLVAYTIADENRFEVWTSGIRGENATFRALGREPRFAANNFELVYTYTDITGNADIWKVDIRNGSTDRVTDADEIDVTADWSRDGRSIAFASARGEAVSVWTIPSSGGKRLRVNSSGYAPRFSPDSRSILFWNRDALWTMDAAGGHPSQIFSGLPNPVTGAWASKRPAFMVNGEIRTADEILFRLPHPAVFPQFDVLRDGRFVVAPIDILETALWAIDLTYKEN
jgi:Tol biopolymer transport system component